jgi:hypothetical protein
MEDGELSEVIVSPAGVHLFRRREMIPRRQPEFEEVYSQVRRDFINERVNLRTQMLMDDLLKATRLERYVQAGLDAFMSAPGSTWERVPLSTAEADTDSGQGSKPQSDNPFSGFSTFD